MIAIQDQRSMTPDEAMAIVLKNIEEGNQEMIEQVRRAKEVR